MEGAELEEVETLVTVILKLGGVMPHSGVAATLNPDPTKRMLPSLKKFYPYEKENPRPLQKKKNISNFLHICLPPR